MQVLRGFALLLLCQSAGEVLARGAGLPWPGPVVGMLLLLVLLTWPVVRAPAAAAADALLAHLSLLFVPVGVGVLSHLALVAEHGLRLAFVLVASTLVGLAVTALVLRALWRGGAPGVEAREDTGDEPGDEPGDEARAGSRTG